MEVDNEIIFCNEYSIFFFGLIAEPQSIMMDSKIVIKNTKINQRIETVSGKRINSFRLQDESQRMWPKINDYTYTLDTSQLTPSNASLSDMKLYILNDILDDHNREIHQQEDTSIIKDSIYLGTVVGNILGDTTTLAQFLEQDSIYIWFEYSRDLFEVVSYELVVSTFSRRYLSYENQGAAIPEWQKKKLSRIKNVNRIFIQEVKAKLKKEDEVNSGIFYFPTKIYKIIKD